VRLRVDNRGRSTARNVAVRVLKLHRWVPANGEWIRSRPELDGRLLQPSDHLAREPDLVDVFPDSERIVDLASVDVVTVALDGVWPQAELESPEIWEHLLVEGPLPEILRPPRAGLQTRISRRDRDRPRVSPRPGSGPRPRRPAPGA
jgi:hypothetical protein